jgi:hypothetical protein
VGGGTVGAALHLRVRLSSYHVSALKRDSLPRTWLSSPATVRGCVNLSHITAALSHRSELTQRQRGTRVGRRKTSTAQQPSVTLPEVR